MLNDLLAIHLDVDAGKGVGGAVGVLAHVLQAGAGGATGPLVCQDTQHHHKEM